MVELIFWYLVLMVVGWLALPLARRFLSQLPDQGFTVAKPLGILLWGFIFWLLVSLGLLQNTTGSVLFSLLVMAGLGVWAAGGVKGIKDVWIWVKSQSRLVLISEIIFLAAFVLWALVRAADPRISGTEKPMELAFINGILRSSSFPPQDPWLSGYAISYYYFGYVMVAMLIRLTGVASGVGFNLAIASWFALTALASYGVLYNLLSAANSGQKKHGQGLFIPDLHALLAPILLLIVSNLGGLLEVLHASGQFWQKAADGTWNSGFWEWLKLPELTNAPSEPFSWSPERVGGIWWWRASRVVQDFDVSGGWREVIDEFPFFTYYLADLHPHLLAMPFALLAISMAQNLYRFGEKISFETLKLRFWVRQVDFWLAAVVFGGLAFLNTWNFPIYLGLFGGVFVYVRYRQEGWRLWQRVKDLVGPILALGAAGIGLYLPFYLGFSSQAGGLLPSLAFHTRGIYFWIMFATLLTPIGIWLIWRWRQTRNWRALKQGGQVGLFLLVVLWVFSYLMGGFGLTLPEIGQGLLSSSQAGLVKLGQNFIEWGGLFYGLQGSSNGSVIIWGSMQSRLAEPGTWLTLVILIALTWGWLVNRNEPNGEEETLKVEGQPQNKLLPIEAPDSFVLLLVLIGAALTLVVEFFYLRDQFGTRMNTIFKFYFETWMVWSIAAGYASAHIWRAIQSGWRWVARTVWVIIFVSGLIYPLFALSPTLNFSNSQNWTLDGNAWFGNYYAEEQAAVNWLNKAPAGVIAEAVGGSYSSAARFATYTGFQSVLGWQGHESQWRGGNKEMGSRPDDLARLYRTSDWNEADVILKQYQIRYVIVGGLERSTYRVSDVKFQSHLSAVFQSDSVSIYEVSQSTK